MIISYVGMKQFFYFVIGGVINTALTYLFYIGLINIFDYRISYTISYIFGIIISYIFNSKIVFNVNIRFITFVFYPLVYVAQIVLAFFVMDFLVRQLSINIYVAPLINSSILMPITFFLGRYILSGFRAPED